MTVRMNVGALDSAISAVEELANDIANARTACINAVPYRGPSLSSLTGGSVTVTAPEWLREQKTDPLGVVLDLARLLDTDGEGEVVWTGSTDGSIQDIKEELGRQIASRAEELEDVESPEDLDEFLETLELLDTYADDPDVTGAFVNAIGPEGLNRLIQQAGSMTGPYADYPNPNGIYEDSSYGEEFERVVAMQDTLAETLSQSVATASLAGNLPANFGEDFVRGGDPRSAAILFDYAARGGHEFGSEFLVSAGDALIEWENGEGGMYWSNFPGNDQQFGTADMNALRDPTVAWMEALSLSTDGSQEVLLDTDRAAYLLERFSPMEDVEGAAAGKVLQTATIDRALDSGTHGRDAATISSWAIEHFGGDAEPLDGIKEELGGIVATYIRDVDRVSYDLGSAEGSGIYGAGDVPGGTMDGEGFPPYGIRLNRDALANLLGDIGDNDSAVSIVGGAASRLNSARLDEAIGAIADNPAPSGSIGTDDPLYNAARNNGSFTGFLYDSMLQGDIASAQGDAEQRQRMAELLLLPADAVKLPGGPIGSYVIGQIKREVTNEFVGDGVSDTIAGSNDAYDDIMSFTQMQALESLVFSDEDIPMGDLAEVWPGAADGDPVPMSELTNEDRTAIINTVRSGGQDYGTAVRNGVDDGRDDLIQQYGRP